MAEWKNLDTLNAYKALAASDHRVDLREVLAGTAGADRVRKYSVPMACGLAYNYAAKQVDDEILAMLADLAKESDLAGKFEELYNGAMINTGEKRLVLHHLTRGQLGADVIKDGVNKRDFYTGEQAKISDFAAKVHSGEIANAAGEKFTTVVQIGIGGSDLGPRAMYIALENWARANDKLLMDARFISNVDPDDAVSVLNTIDVAHALFILVSKSGTTLVTLTNEAFVKNALRNAGLDPAKHMIAVTSETSPLASSSDYLAAFFMDDYIGGRYSSTSAVGGAVLSLAFGSDVFAEFLDGAALAHIINFFDTRFHQQMPHITFFVRRKKSTKQVDRILITGFSLPLQDYVFPAPYLRVFFSSYHRIHPRKENLCRDPFFQIMHNELIVCRQQAVYTRANDIYLPRFLFSRLIDLQKGFFDQIGLLPHDNLSLCKCESIHIARPLPRVSSNVPGTAEESAKNSNRLGNHQTNVDDPATAFGVCGYPQFAGH